MTQPTRSVPAGWIAWDPDSGDTFTAGYRGATKLYRTEAIAKMAIGKGRLAGGIIAVPVLAIVPLDKAPMVVPLRCQRCGHTKNDHRYRHPFVPTE